MSITATKQPNKSDQEGFDAAVTYIRKIETLTWNLLLNCSSEDDKFWELHGYFDYLERGFRKQLSRCANIQKRSQLLTILRKNLGEEIESRLKERIECGREFAEIERRYAVDPTLIKRKLGILEEMVSYHKAQCLLFAYDDLGKPITYEMSKE